MSKTEWLCPFNKLVSCDDNCMASGGRDNCIFIDSIEKASQSIKSISDNVDEATGSIHRIGNALAQLAEETSPYDGGMQIREGLDSLGSSMPDMSDISESIDALARMINPTEYKQYMHEISQRLINQAKVYEQMHESKKQEFEIMPHFEIPLFRDNDADSD